MFDKVVEIFRKVFADGKPLGFLDPNVWKETLSVPEVFWPALVVLNIIVFTETGLLIGFLLPGDSLLVVVGFVASQSGWNLPILIGTLCVSAIVGDTVGYWIGAKAGAKIFSRPDGRFFKQAYIQRARDFYDKHGGKTIIMARFIPIVRTFAPVVAGAAKMNYRTFVAYNVVGGILWVTSMILFGYFLIDIIDPLLKPIFGDQFTIAKQIDKLAVAIILISVAPIAWKAFQDWRKNRKAPATTPNT
ncbi:MAG: DedA family protein [Fimbriiglobus sp.]